MRVGRYAHSLAVDHADRHLMIEVIRQLQNNLIARVGDGQQRIHERHIAPGRYDDTLRFTQRDTVFL